MIQKICPHCKGDSYSSHDDPGWKCPYCGRPIPKIEEGKGMNFYPIGIKVEVFDGSWSKTFEEGIIRDSHGIELANREFAIIADGKFPTGKGADVKNNLILLASDNNQIVYIHSRLVKPYRQSVKCPRCGCTVKR